MARAFSEVRRNLPAAQKAAAQGEFMRLGGPEVITKVELMAARAFENMKGMSAAMKTGLNRVLSDALVYGRGARDTADRMNKQLGISYRRSLVIARTEIMHAHAEGKLDAFERLGISELGVEVEWSTAGDDHVCPICASMAGTTYTIKEARGLLPRHPNCRCTFIPVVETTKSKSK